MHSSYISSFKNFALKILIFLFLTVFCFAIVLEYYNPLKIQNGSVLVYKNHVIPELPMNITVRYNNLGYVGESYSDTITRDKMCFIGSSKTQSIYIPVSFQWTTKVLKNQQTLWFNNCGKDGATISDWIIEVGKLKKISPQVIVILVDPFDGHNNIAKSKDTSFLQKSQFFSTVVLPIYRIVKNELWGTDIGHKKVNWKGEEIENSGSASQYVELEKNKILNNLNELAASIHKINAQPIFISCPTPYGNYTNSEGVEMNTIKNSIQTDLFYKDFSNVLQSYCSNNRVFFINGYSLSKNTEYFYDHGHFSVSGSAAFAGLILPQLDSFVKSTKLKK